MSDADICILGAAKLVNGVPTWQGVVPVANDNDAVEPMGESDCFQALGVSGLPCAKDGAGAAEAVALRNVGGRDVVYVGARDTRNTSFLGKMSPGDTTVHATGPGAVAQCFLKNNKRQAGLATENTKNETMLFMLDGKNSKGQWVCNGAIIEINDSGDIAITSSGGAGIIISDKIYFVGEVSLPGMTSGFVLAQMLPAGQPPGNTAVLLTPVMGVSK